MNVVKESFMSSFIYSRKKKARDFTKSYAWGIIFVSWGWLGHYFGQVGVGGAIFWVGGFGGALFWVGGDECG